MKSGNLLFLAGHVPYNADGSLAKGKCGEDFTVEEGYKFAAAITANLLKTVKDNIGELTNVEKIVKLNGMVNSGGNFHDHPKVINGASDLLVEVFGKEIGAHARTAVGCPSLPFNVPVEIDAVIQIR